MNLFDKIWSQSRNKHPNQNYKQEEKRERVKEGKERDNKTPSYHFCKTKEKEREKIIKKKRMDHHPKFHNIFFILLYFFINFSHIDDSL